MRRETAVWATATAIVIAVIVIWVFRAQLFGAGTWGAGGNLVAWVLCGGLAFGWTWLMQHERHVQAMAQATRNHQERMKQAQDHHDDLKRHITAETGGDRM